MANWVEINWEALNHPRQEQIRGVGVTVYFSPYDMPEAAKGDYDTTEKRFVIRFQYLGGEEPIEYRNAAEDIRLGIGKKTQRLHRIQVDVDRLRANFVALNLENQVAEKVKQAIDEFSTTTTTPAPTGNYAAASGALDQQRNRVYSDLAAAGA